MPPRARPPPAARAMAGELAARRQAEMQQEKCARQERRPAEIEAAQRIAPTAGPQVRPRRTGDREPGDEAERNVEKKDPAPRFRAHLGTDDKRAPERPEHPAKGVDRADQPERRRTPPGGSRSPTSAMVIGSNAPPPAPCIARRRSATEAVRGAHQSDPTTKTERHRERPVGRTDRRCARRPGS